MALLVARPEPATAAGIPQGSRLYAELAPAFRAFHPDLVHFTILDRKRVAARHAVVIVQAMAPGEKMAAPPSAPRDFKREAFGVFIVDAVSEALRLPLDIFATGRWLDYGVSVVEANDRRATVSRGGATYGDGAEKVTYFYDLAKRAVLSRIVHQDVRISLMVGFEGALYAIGSGNDETAIVAKLAAGADPRRAGSYEVTDRIGGEPIELVRTARAEGGALVLAGENRRYVLRAGRWSSAPNPDAWSFRHHPGGGVEGLADFSFWVPPFRVQENLLAVDDAGGTTRLFIWNSQVSTNGRGPDVGSGIYELGTAGRRFHRLPLPSYDVFQKRRPRRVAEGYTRDATTIEMEIGPFQLQGRRLWFGTSFYDGEGNTGIGGLGYFDLDARRYRVTYDSAVADWSTAAILVEERDVWLGLAHYTEGLSRAGGLARYRRDDTRIRTYQVPAIILVIRRVGDHLLLGTADGMYVLSGETLTRVGLVLDVGERYSVRVGDR